MTYQASEHDYKYLKKLMPLLYKSVCKKINGEILAILIKEKQENVDKYNRIRKIVKDFEDEMHEVFNDIKRTTAFGKIYGLHRRNIISADEFSGFSNSTKELVKK